MLMLFFFHFLYVERASQSLGPLRYALNSPVKSPASKRSIYKGDDYSSAGIENIYVKCCNFCGGKARTLASTEGFIYLFVRGFACVTWSSAKEPEAGDGKENEREPGDEVGGACRVEIGHIGFWRVVSCGFFLYCFDFSCSCSCSSLQQLTKSY